MQQTFEDNINTNKPIFYHFLDGFLNSSIGNTTENTYEFIKSNGASFIKDANINIGYPYKDNNYYKIKYYNFTKKTEGFIILLEDGTPIVYPHNDNNFKYSNLTDYNRNVYKDLENIFNFAIIQVGDELHAVSIMIRITGHKIIITLINSGDGLLQEDYINGLEYANPFKSHLFELTEENKISVFNHILAMCFFKLLYFDINNTIHNLKTSFYIDNIYFTEISNETIMQLNFITNNLPNIKDIIIGSHTLGYYAQLQKIQIFSTDKISSYTTTPNTDGIQKTLYCVKESDLKFTQSLYELLCKISGKTFIIKFHKRVKNIRPNKFKNLGLHNNIINKMIFHFNDGIPCIIPQESGSCSWYSIYWGLLFYKIDSTEEDYINFVNDINEHFYKIALNIFSINNFVNEMRTDDFRLMKRIYAKLCDIGLMDIKILEQVADILFTTDFTITNTDIQSITNSKVITYDYLHLENILPGNILYNDDDIHDDDIHGDIFYNDVLNLIRDIMKLNTDGKSIIFTNTLIIFYYSVFIHDNKFPALFHNSFSNNESFLEIIEKLIDPQQIVIKKNFDMKKSLYLQKLNDYYYYLSESTYENETCYSYTYYHIASIFFNEKDTIIEFANFINRMIITTEILNIYYTIIIDSLKTDKIKEIITEINIKISELFPVINYIPTSRRGAERFFYRLTVYSNFFISLENKMITDTYYLKKYNGSYLFLTDDGIPIQKNIKKWDDYDKLRKYLYSNPNYIFVSDFLYDSFIKCNLEDIFLPINEPHKKKLIEFFAEKYWEYKDSENKVLVNILINLHLLIYKSDCILSDDYNNIYEIDDICYLFQFKKTKHSQNIFEFDNILKEIVFEKSKDEFISYITDNNSVFLLNKYEILLEKIKKIYQNIHIDNNLFVINDVKLDEHLNSQSKNRNFYIGSTTGDESIFPLINFFCSKNEMCDYIWYYSEENKNIVIIIINDNFIFEIIGTCKKQNKNFVFNITDIFIDGYKAEKYNMIYYPFKYSMPLTCNFLIYKVENVFKIIYFTHIEIPKEHYILGDTFYLGTTVIVINENNMLYPKIDIPNCVDNFSTLCASHHIRPLNILFIGQQPDENDNRFFNGYIANDKMYKLFDFNFDNFINSEINFDNLQIDKIELMNKITDFTHNVHITLSKNIDENTTKLLNLINLSNNDASKSFSKLLEKIEVCRIIEGNTTNIKLDLEKLSNSVLTSIKSDVKYYEKISLNNLLSEYLSIHLNFLLKLKVYNISKILLDLLDDTSLDSELKFCSQIKILKSLMESRKYNLKYNFEVLFETISGNELLEEQHIRYIDIIKQYLLTLTEKDRFQSKYNQDNQLKSYTSNSYKIINYQQTGGNIYPLHHFMMGKGKSSVMTPLLSLYFTLIHKKRVYAIMPEHLVNDSQVSLQYCINCFACNITIISDVDIKNDFLSGKFNEIDNDNIFIIDEFDSLLDPTKSNFNLVKKKTKSVYKIFQFIYNIAKKIKNNPGQPIEKIKIQHDIYNLTSESAILIRNDIDQIIKSITSNTLIENINWGIDPFRYYAVPYSGKDKPIHMASFSSVILTIFLTIYYYIFIKNYEISDIVMKIIKENNLFTKIFNITHQPDRNIEKIVRKMINDEPDIKYILFDEIFNNLFKNMMIPDDQLNCSFVDILNIDNIYKIGYSGTINLELPPLPRLENKFMDIQSDYDEFINVGYAILNARIFIVNTQVTKFIDNIVINYIDYFKSINIDLQNYNAFIDQAGIFKNELNKNVALSFFNYFKSIGIERDIIYISEKDYKFVLDSKIGIETEYNNSIKYVNPFIYYSQSHVIGVNIEQKYYSTLNGLITIIPNSVYTNVAQASFRLRRLNIGHSIDILYFTNDIILDSITSSEILGMLKCNEEKDKSLKQDLLIYQTIKSELRKKRKDNKKASYREKVKYYYFEPIPEQINDYYNNIINKKELNDSNLKGLFRKLRNKEKLDKLIYNINSHSTEITQSKEIEKKTVKNMETMRIDKLEIDIPIINLDYIGYIFSHISHPDIFNRITLQLDDFIHFVPNITIQSNGTGFYKNHSGYMFVLFSNLTKLLLIPGYMAPIFYESYVLLEPINLKLINFNMYDKFQENKELINCFKHKDFFMFLSDGVEYIKDHMYKNIFITEIILAEQETLLPAHNDFMDKYYIDEVTNQIMIDNINYEFDVWISSEYVNKIIINQYNYVDIDLEPFITTNKEYCEKNKLKHIKYKKYKIKYEK